MLKSLKLKTQQTVMDISGSRCMQLSNPNNSKSSVRIKIFTTYIPWQSGCSEHTWHSQPRQRHGADTCGWTRCSRNAPSARSEDKRTRIDHSAGKRSTDGHREANNQHARARTLPQDSHFLQPPSSEWNVSQYIPCSNCELATQNRERRTESSSKPHMHACIRNKESHASQSTQKKPTPTLHKTPAYPAKSQRRGDHST
jgi:hypothetical protein